MDLDFEQPIVKIEERIEELRKLSDGRSSVDFSSEIAEMRGEIEILSKRMYSRLTPWQTVQVARHARRPILRDYIDGMCSDFVELHGDRCFGDDQAIVGGFATIQGRRVMLIGHQKGRSTEEKVACNFGMANPDGYRKALRLMKLAERYRLPVVSLVDTPAAYPGKEAEERGQAEAIARNLVEMSVLETPIVVVITGEGGSGGALGIAVGDVVMMLSYAIYSVIPPEGCAAILWRDGAKAPQAADALKITAEELLKIGAIDEIVAEPAGGAHRFPRETIQAVQESLLRHLTRLDRIPIKKLLEQRYAKYAAMGHGG